MVGFLLGKGMTLRHMRRHGREILWVSIVTVVGTASCVLVGLLLLGASTPVAILLAAISCATAPTATADVIHEAGAKGPFTETLLGVVAVDDAWGLILFSAALAVTGTLAGDGDAVTAMLSGGYELGGALVVGVGLGLPAAFLLGHLRKGEPTLAGALGCVLLGGGLALWLEVSFLSGRDGDGRGGREPRRAPRAPLPRAGARRVAVPHPVLRSGRAHRCTWKP